MGTDILTPAHVEHTGRIEVGRPMPDAFAFFTPEGERAWAPGWQPEYLYPRDGTARPGLTFRTNAGGEETLWYVVRFDPARGEAEYVRITLGSRLGTVTIRCESDGADATTVWVTYRLTAVSSEGNAALASFDAAAFARMMTEWQHRISALIS